MKNLGLKIREERRRLDLTLDQIAQLTGLSKSFLSQIERSTADPSISTLKKISQALGISVYQLFMDNGERNGAVNYPAPEENVFHRNGFVRDIKFLKYNQRKKFILPSSKIHYELITPDLKRQIEILFIGLSPGDSTGSEPIIDSAGEKCFLVLKGSLELQIKKDIYRLDPGDSIYFPGDFPYICRGIGKERIEAIVVLSPPSF